jgi:hypothetical protein
MVFPATPLGITAELYLSGAWTNLTSLVYGRDDLVITRGRSGEGSEVERSTCRATANNRSGDLSPRNPTGTYYGQLGRNTPMRVRLTPGPPGYLLMFDDGRANTPDSANLSITGDIDIRLDIRPDHWDRAQGLANKWLSTGNQRSWALYLGADGTLSFAWSADGSATITKTSTAAVTVPASGRLAVRVTLDVDNGAAGNDVKFYTATDIDSSFSQLGATVTTAGVTSIFDSTASLEIGSSQGVGAGDDITGRLYGFELRQGIAGTLRADVNLSEEEPGPGPFTDAQSLVWTLAADASIVRPDIRFSGELSDLPQRWDTSGRDVYVPLEASGILRRLGQGASPLRSALYRGYTRLATAPKAYWPCEDGEGATELASALGGPPMTFQGGTPDLASHTGFKCSAPLPTFNGSQWTGIVPAYSGTGSIQVFFLMQVPDAGALDEEGIIAVYTSGTAQRWSILYDSAGTGNLRIIATDSAGTELLNSSINFGVNGKLLRVDLELQQNGANIDWALETLEVGASAIVGLGGTVNTQTISRCTAVVMNAGGDHTTIAAGHISVHDNIRDLFGLAAELNAHDGETAGRRAARLCSEESIVFRGIGDLDAAAAMGPQLPQELVTLLRECAAADGGILLEPRDLLGLAYRTRDSLCAQDAALELDYDAKHLSSIEPTDDDQQTRNDITAKRVGGASARAVKESGALSVLAPPGGVGRYDEEVTLNLQADGQLPDMAGWRLHLGTVDEARYPVLGLDLARSVFVASSALALAAQDLDIGDRLTVADPPAWLPPDDISQLAQGFTEVLGNFTHRIAVVCAPETPFGQAGVYGASRYSSDGSALAEDLTTGETGVDVATPVGPLWSHDDGDIDILVGGERMTVTAVAGATSPQTFTVTRSVNAVVKTHLTGAAVELFRPAVYVP